MKSLNTSLEDRVRDVLEEHKTRELLSTTGRQATLDELVTRIAGLEQALIEIAAEVERVAAKSIPD